MSLEKIYQETKEGLTPSIFIEVKTINEKNYKFLEVIKKFDSFLLKIDTRNLDFFKISCEFKVINHLDNLKNFLRSFIKANKVVQIDNFSNIQL